MRFPSIFILSIFLVVVAGCSACGSQVPCSANRDCTGGQVCAAGANGSFCVEAGEEGEGEDGAGEGEGEGEPVASLRLQSGNLEGDEAFEVTLEWTLSAVSGCELQADRVDTGVALTGQTSTAMVIEDSQTLQIVCNEAASEELVFVVHDVSEIEGPIAVSVGASATMTFSVEGVSSCAVSTDGVATNLTQAVITGSSGSFTDVAEADKSYTLTCTGSEGEIVRTFELNVLTVDVVVPPPSIVAHGDSVSLTIVIDAAAICALVTTAPDGTDRRAEGGASVVVNGDERTFTLANVTSVRAYLVECTLFDASASNAASTVRIRPRILQFDARIPNIEDLGGAPATLELLVSVDGLDAGGSCVVNDGTTETANSGANVVLETGPSLATYTLRCGAPGGDATPNSAGGFQVLWRDATAADLVLLAELRFAMRDVVIMQTSTSSIDLGLLVQVGGDLTIAAVSPSSSSLTLDLGALTDVAGALTVGMVLQPVLGLENLALPRLRSSGGLDVSLSGLSTIGAPELAVMRGSRGIGINAGSGLATISFPVLSSTPYLAVMNGPDVQEISAPALTSLTGTSTGLFLANMSTLSVLDIPNLQEIAGDVHIEDTNLQQVYFPQLTVVGGGLSVSDNASMLAVRLPEVTSIGDAGGVDSFSIHDNPVLANLDFQSLATTDGAGQFVVMGNAFLTCEEISSVYCPLTARDSTPTVTTNRTASCANINDGC